MKLNNTLPPMGSLAHNKAPQAKPNLNTQRDGSVELVITTMNTLNLSGFLNSVTRDSIPHLSARIVETEHVIQNRVLADAGRPGSRSFLEITKKELDEISEFLRLYLQGDPLRKKAKPVIFAAYLGFRNPYDLEKLRGIREDLRRLNLPKNELLNVDLNGDLFNVDANGSLLAPEADRVHKLLKVRFDPADTESTLHGDRGFESNLETIRGIQEITGQMGKLL
jgi:hypothetical protein